MALMTKDEVLTAVDLTHEDVVVPEWKGATVRIMAMDGTARDEWEMAVEKRRDPNNKKSLDARGLKAALIAVTAVDENGEKLFTSADVEKLNCKNGSALDRLAVVAMRLNGLTETALDEMRKNSESVPNSVAG